MRKRIQNNDDSLLGAPNQFIFQSEVMKEIHYEVKNYARLAVSVLLVGESGVGKDQIAYQIHKLSPRKNKPYVCVPIHTITSTLMESELFGYEKGAFSGANSSKAGRFEATDGGTLYLPEIAELPESIQLKLLYFLQYRSFARLGQDPFKSERKLDVRLIFATNQDIEALVDEGKIRSDFYHRINILKIKVPPLRERKEDIMPLINYFVDKYSLEFVGKKIKIDPSVKKIATSFEWPGNVRELENTIERILLKFELDEKKPTITGKHFENIISQKRKKKDSKKNKTIIETDDQKIIDYKTAQLNFKKHYFQKLLDDCNGNIPKAAKVSKLTPQGLRKILKQLGLK